MNCIKCNSQIEEGALFCTQCGEPVNVTDGGGPELMQGSSEAPIKKPAVKRTKLLLIISACVLVAACAVLIPVLIEADRSARYEEAFALMDSGQTMQAKEGFTQLGEYKEAAKLAEDCQDIMDYESANSLMKAEDYAAAKKIFDSLDGYEKSATLATECQNIMDYDSAVALMDSAQTAKALDIFLKLGEYSDSADLAEECQNRIDYDSATALMQAGDFEAAKTVFSELVGYKDSLDLRNTCAKEIDYSAAATAFDKGEYYTAYVIFYELFDFKDSKTRAEQCIQPSPETGEVYRNPDYSTKKCPLTFKTPDDGMSSLIKVYTEDGKLVSTVFIASGKKVKIKLPKGTYRFKAASGEDWFGDDDMFGDKGYYSLVMFGEDKDTWTLKSNYIYTLSLRVNKGGYEGIPQDRDKF